MVAIKNGFPILTKCLSDLRRRKIPLQLKDTQSVPGILFPHALSICTSTNPKNKQFSHH